MSRVPWAYRIVLLCSPLVIGGLSGVLFWGEVDGHSENAEYASFAVLLVGLVTIGVVDFKVVEWVGWQSWFALALIGAHLMQSAAFVLGGFFPFVLGVAGLELADVDGIALECCAASADDDFGQVFQEYLGVTAVLALFCAPVSAAVWWASRALPPGRRQ